MSLPEEKLALLHIEEQAIVQVIIKEVANHLDIKDNSKLNTVRDGEGQGEGGMQ